MNTSHNWLRLSSSGRVGCIRSLRNSRWAARNDPGAFIEFCFTEPNGRPVSPQEIAATVYHALGLPGRTTIPGPDGNPVALATARPVEELFR